MKVLFVTLEPASLILSETSVNSLIWSRDLIRSSNWIYFHTVSVGLKMSWLRGGWIQLLEHLDGIRPNRRVRINKNSLEKKGG